MAQHRAKINPDIAGTLARWEARCAAEWEARCAAELEEYQRVHPAEVETPKRQRKPSLKRYLTQARNIGGPVSVTDPHGYTVTVGAHVERTKIAPMANEWDEVLR
jgi:hypothetical protein